MKKMVAVVVLAFCLIVGNTTMYQGETAETQEISKEEIGTAYVGYQKKSTYLITIPKVICFSEEKSVDYSITVVGDIAANEKIKVAPQNTLEEREDEGIYISMKDISNAEDNWNGDFKEDVIATIHQPETEWTRRECIAENGTTKSGQIIAEDLTAGVWGGTLVFQVTLENKAIP